MTTATLHTVACRSVCVSVCLFGAEDYPKAQRRSSMPINLIPSIRWLANERPSRTTTNATPKVGHCRSCVHCTCTASQTTTTTTTPPPIIIVILIIIIITRSAGQSPTWGRRAPQVRVESQFRQSKFLSQQWQLANDYVNCILEPRGVWTCVSVRALRVSQYARYNNFCLWTKVHHVSCKSLVRIFRLAWKL